VERDYLAQRRDTANDVLYDSLRSRYTIRYEDETAPVAPDGSDSGPTRSP
jgi:hypothetical protein